MRFVLETLLTLVLAMAAPLPEVPALQKAMDEVEQVRKLVAAGVTPRRELEAAEKKLREAQDQQILDELLYGQTLQVEKLTERQATELVEAANRYVGREQLRFDGANRLVTEGVAARSTLGAFQEELGRAHKTMGIVQSRAALVNELADMVRAELEALEHQPQEEAPQGAPPVMERFGGDGTLAVAQVKRLTLAFEKQFRKPLPVSARGETALHKSLGFDHRGRLDVALNPDQEEGVWLRHYLESVKIPFLAFRKWVPGKATAPHIHVGPPSTRLRIGD